MSLVIFSYELAENPALSARNLMSLVKNFRAFGAVYAYELSEKSTFSRFPEVMSLVSYEFTATLLYSNPDFDSEHGLSISSI